MNLDKLPVDSIFHLWAKAYSIVETPLSYTLACGMAAFGAMLKRQTYLDQVNWKVFPNMSVLLVGPSGLGKDTAINEAKKFMNTLGYIPDVYGKTMEQVHKNLLEVGKEDFDTPAAGYVIAAELTAFLGGKDYQKSMTQELTDLLSTNDSLDVSIKSEGKKVIHKPTVTMFAGSTEEWLHKAMPSGALDGGLFPRFLVVCEHGYEAIQRPVAFPAYSNDRNEVEEAMAAKQAFLEQADKHIRRFYRRIEECVPLPSAREVYENWYRNRLGKNSKFSAAVMPYANRSRDQVHRIAIICAASRGHNYIEVEDYEFAISVMNSVAQRIERAVKPPTVEAQIGRAILPLLPAVHQEIMRSLTERYTGKQVLEAIVTLMSAGQIKKDDRGRYIEV